MEFSFFCRRKSENIQKKCHTQKESRKITYHNIFANDLVSSVRGSSIVQNNMNYKNAAEG